VRTHLLVTPGRATAAVRALGATSRGALQLHFLPWLGQREYDELLWACDLNFVRGEDSLVRGLLAGVPSVWQIYPQDDGAHHAKLEAFLRWLAPPAGLRDFFLRWNGISDGSLPLLDLAAWQSCAAAALREVHALPELADGLVRAASRGR
jgi:uncharacterized repeat protein (TIGR03837 family)